MEQTLVYLVTSQHFVTVANPLICDHNITLHHGSIYTTPTGSCFWWVHYFSWFTKLPRCDEVDTVMRAMA